ncbi:hypothetical protein IE992_12960 [Klebsiella pneumoniae]|uniref:Uncharacterized protein n=2 Tax=Klebsiella pneumoniae TaxID=573 RepID=A0A927E0L5_KLEPN|nr:hypothetical protein [Klebsiella pneumoniae]
MRKGNEFRAQSIFTKTENIKFLSARKDIYFHKVIGNITVNSYLRFILSEDLRPIMLGIFLMELLNGLSNKPDLAQKKGYKSTNKEKPGMIHQHIRLMNRLTCRTK